MKKPGILNCLATKLPSNATGDIFQERNKTISSVTFSSIFDSWYNRIVKKFM